MRPPVLQFCLWLLLLLFSAGAPTRALGKASGGPKTAVPEFCPLILTDAGENPPQPLDRIRETASGSFDCVPDVEDGPNLYSYVRQNPWSAFDPQGLATMDTGLGILPTTAVDDPPVEEAAPKQSALPDIFQFSYDRAPTPGSAMRDAEMRNGANLMEMFNPRPAPVKDRAQMTHKEYLWETAQMQSKANMDILAAGAAGATWIIDTALETAAIEAATGGIGGLVSLSARVTGRIALRESAEAFAAKRTLNTYGDALRSSLGPGRLSHAEEWAATMSRAEEMGVGLELRSGTMAYEPAFGRPGRLIIDPDASIGALRHEFQHALDDAAIGHPGFRVMANPIQFWTLEFRGYMQEINTARSTGSFDAGRAILQEMRDRRFEILGK